MAIKFTKYMSFGGDVQTLAVSPKLSHFPMSMLPLLPKSYCPLPRPPALKCPSAFLTHNQSNTYSLCPSHPSNEPLAVCPRHKEYKRTNCSSAPVGFQAACAQESHPP